MFLKRSIEQSLGERGEDIASQYLSKKGFTVVQRNFRIQGGEIDIIAQKAKELIFVEVKTRSSEQFGHPEEGVTFSKCLRMRKAIRIFLRRYPSATLFRVDIIAVAIDRTLKKEIIHHIENIDFPEV